MTSHFRGNKTSIKSKNYFKTTYFSCQFSKHASKLLQSNSGDHQNYALHTQFCTSKQLKYISIWSTAFLHQVLQDYHLSLLKVKGRVIFCGVWEQQHDLSSDRLQCSCQEVSRTFCSFLHSHSEWSAEASQLRAERGSLTTGQQWIQQQWIKIGN